VTVQPLGGDNFKIKLDAAAPSVGEAKAEIARTQGTSEARQELYKVAVRADGGAVREDDAEPEPLNDDATELGDGEMVAMAVKELPLPLMWRTCDEKRVVLSEGGAVATMMNDDEDDDEDKNDGDNEKGTLVTSGVELTAGKHFWEVEPHLGDYAMHGDYLEMYIGIAKPNLDFNGDYAQRESDDGWFMWTGSGNGDGGDLCGNSRRQGPASGSQPGRIYDGHRVGVVLDLDEGSLRFFMNGVQHGPGYPAGSVTGPVVCAVTTTNPQLDNPGTSVRLLPQDTARTAAALAAASAAAAMLATA
jgi:hypothetical protein